MRRATLIRIIDVMLVLLCVVGLADTVVLHVQEQKGTVGQFCQTLAGTFGASCEKVLTSKYAAIGGVGLTVLGILYYLSLLWISVWSRIESESGGGRAARVLMAGISGTGIFVSSYLVYLQASVIQAWCPFCLISAGVTALIFIFASVRLALGTAESPEVSKESGAAGILVFVCVLLTSGWIVTIMERVPDRVESKLEQMIRYVPRRSVPQGGLIYGSDSATITAMAFLDFTCNHCRTFEQEVFPKIKAEFIDSGKVRWVNKLLPHTDKGAPLLFGIAGICAREFPDSDVVERSLFAYPLDSPKTGMDALFDALKKGNVSQPTALGILQCAQSRAQPMHQQLVVEVEQALSYGLRGPPAFVLDGIAFQGSMDYKTMSDLLNLFVSQRNP